MEPRSFLILHGWQGSGPGHWQTWLAARLRADGERVAYPDFPDADLPSLRPWCERLEGELAALPSPAVVVCHSVACLLWLHHLAAGGAPSSRLLLVAPPSQTAAIPEIEPFLPAPLPPPPLAGARLVCSDDDPYCPEGALALYGEPLKVPTDVLPGRGHLNRDAGYGPWPAVEAWCLHGDRPITA